MSLPTSVTKREETYHYLRMAILDGRFRPGEAIPERAVAQDLKVSRIPIREALIRLERDGLVVIVSWRGAFVRTFTADDLRQLYEVRQALEGMAARRAAGRMDPDRLAEFRRRFQVFLDDPEEAIPEKIQQLTTPFHDAIIADCGNPLIQEMVTDIRGQIQLSRGLSYGYASREWVMSGIQQHLDVLEALAQGDGPRSEGLMRAHIQAWYDFRVHTGDDVVSP